jgi:hypothetical protein
MIKARVLMRLICDDQLKVVEKTMDGKMNKMKVG